ncbi:MAG: GNAT family N-acetyltransferase [Bradymonadia bacterium]
MSTLPTDQLTFRLTPWADLSKDDLYAILHLRDLVFVVGQGITSEPEVDGRDPECAHAMLWHGELLIGTARVFTEQSPQVVGRVAVHPERQRGGYGTWLMEQVQEAMGDVSAELHAQAHLEAWYARLGWRREGDVFYEAEIPHVMMVRP